MDALRGRGARDSRGGRGPERAPEPKGLPGRGLEQLLAMGVVLTHTTFPPGASEAWILA